MRIRKQKGLLASPFEARASFALELTEQQLKRLKEIKRLPVENRKRDFLRGFYPATMKASPEHSSLLSRFEKTGNLLGYVPKQNYLESQWGWEYDIVWKEAGKLPPSHVVEVQNKGNLDSALMKLKHAKDIW
jgi:hypothetical protein